MDTAEILRTDEQLIAWDWLADLKAQDRPVIWLARKTGTAYRTVYRYKDGDQAVPLDWLRKAAIILGKGTE